MTNIDELQWFNPYHIDSLVKTAFPYLTLAQAFRVGEVLSTNRAINNHISLAVMQIAYELYPNDKCKLEFYKL